MFKKNSNFIKMENCCEFVVKKKVTEPKKEVPILKIYDSIFYQKRTAKWRRKRMMELQDDESQCESSATA